MRYTFRSSRQLKVICLCKRRTTSRATLLVVLLLQLCQTSLVTDDPEYIYLLPNAFISKCGPDTLQLVLVEEETPSDLYGYIPFVALQAFCKVENGLCRQSNVTVAVTEKKEVIKLRMGRQTNCSGMPVYDNNVCSLKMEAQVYGGDPEYYNNTFTCKFQEAISPDPEYIYLLPNASISECGPDKLQVVLVEEETPGDLYSYISPVALQVFCKLENGHCRQSNITHALTEKKEVIKLRMGRQANCSGMPVYDNNVCTLKMEGGPYGDPEFSTDTFTCKASQETISPVNTTQPDFVAQTSTNAEMSVPHPSGTTTLSDLRFAVIGSAVPASLLFLLLFIAILLLTMILLSIRRDKRKMKIPPNTKALFLLTLDTSTMNSETISEDKVTIYDTPDTDYSRLKSPDRMAGNASIQCISHDCQSKYSSDPEDMELQLCASKK